MDAYGRMKELVEVLNRYARLYYEEDAPAVSDAEYDALYDELLALEESEGYSLKNSPTHRVGGAPQKKFEQAKHLLRLYSLDKCRTREELVEWYDKTVRAAGKPVALSAEYKFDGLTLSLLYEGGKLTRATTRGDGVTGEVVTAQVKTIRRLPREISYKGTIEIQGEGIMKLSALARYNETASEPLKNARNGAAGAIRNLDPAVTAARDLSFVAYNVGYSDREFATQREVHDFLAAEGFETEDNFKVVADGDEAFAFGEKHLAEADAGTLCAWAALAERMTREEGARKKMAAWADRALESATDDACREEAQEMSSRLKTESSPVFEKRGKTYSLPI